MGGRAGQRRATHYPGCWREHHACAIAECERLGERASLLAMKLAFARQALQDCLRDAAEIHLKIEHLRKTRPPAGGSDG